MAIRSKSPETEADFKSQYFDALETLSEDEQSESNDVTQTTMLQDESMKVTETPDDDYTDIESENGANEYFNKPIKPKIIDVKQQPIAIQRRVKALKRLLVEQKKVE